jgi:hypothetical protein
LPSRPSRLWPPPSLLSNGYRGFYPPIPYLELSVSCWCIISNDQPESSFWTTVGHIYLGLWPIYVFTRKWRSRV